LTLTVFKYPIPSDDYFQIDLPVGAKVLTIQTQHGNPQMWVLLDPSEPYITHYFRIAGTGHPIEEPQEDLRYIGTCQVLGGDLIFHLFEIVKLKLSQEKMLQIEAQTG
jgi:hypothetical protein